MHVLVIQDDPDTRDLLHHALKNAGYRVSQAKRVSEALRLSHIYPDIDVVLIDMHPGHRFSAVDVAHEMRNGLRKRHYVLASGDWDALEPCCPDDMTVLRKPYGKTELLRAVGQGGVPYRQHGCAGATRSTLVPQA